MSTARTVRVRERNSPSASSAPVREIGYALGRRNGKEHFQRRFPTGPLPYRG